MRTFGFSAEQQDEIWQRWRAGESQRAIARRMGISRPATVRDFLAWTGGVRRAPPCRSPRQLSAAEREEISRGVAAGQGCRTIARSLGRAPSTISREINRNSDPGIGDYHPFAATSDPASPWQCGSNENTKGLIRQYFSKGGDLSGHTVADLTAVAGEVNNRPRKISGWDTPAQRFTRLLAQVA